MTKIKILFMLLFVAGVIGSISPAYALTPAGTEISNQSSVTYRDAAGNMQTVNSNQVTTIVLPIYGLSITPDGTVDEPGQTQSGSPGATVYFQYTLINTGNETDSYDLSTMVDPSSDFTPNNIKIFYDTNGNGVVDPGEFELPAGVLADVSPNDPISLIVTYQVPVTVQTNEAVYVDLQGVSQSDTGESDTENFHATIIVDDAVIVANKSASPVQAAAGDTVTYTISGSNTGSAPTTPVPFQLNDGSTYYGLLIADPLPAYDGVSFQVVEGSPDGAPNQGTILYMINGTPDVDIPVEDWNGQWQVEYSSEATAIGFITGNTTAGTGVIDPGQSFNFSFDVRIPVNHPSETVDNVAVLEYEDSTGEPGTTTTNIVSIVVGGTGYESVAVMIGPYNNSTHHDLAIAGEDTTFIETISASEAINIQATILNAGNSNDVINLNVYSKPAGWNISFYKLDGVTPLTDTNTDGLPDVGNIGPKVKKGLIVRVTVPSNYPGGQNENVMIKATSSIHDDGDFPDFSTVVNGYTSRIGWDDILLQDIGEFAIGDFININHEVRRISEIDGNTVVVSNLENNPINQPVTGILVGKNLTSIFFENITGAALEYYNSPPADPDSVTKVGVAGENVDFPLTIENPALMNDTYTLTHNKPTGWIIKYYKDDDADGVPDNLTPISSIQVLGQGLRALVARVNIPEGADIGNYPITYIATSTNNAAITDQFTDYVVIETAPSVLLDPDRTGTGIPGYTVEYYHQLINTGNTVLPLESYFTITSSQDWAEDYLIFQKNPTTEEFVQLDIVDGNHMLAFEVPLSSTSTIKVKFFIPSAPEGTIETAEITFIGQGVANGATDSATDITTIVTGNIFQEKRVVNVSTEADTTWENAGDYNEGLPGNTLKYFVHYKNIGNAPVDLVSVYDAIPTYTTYVGGTAKFEMASGLVEYSTDGGVEWSDVEPAEPNTVTNIRWSHLSGGILEPGEFGRISFKVTID